MNIQELTRSYILESYQLNASDIHFNPHDEVCSIYYRIKGVIQFQKEIKLEVYLKIVRFLKFQTRLDTSQTRYPQDGSFNFLTSKGKKLFLRISTIPLLDNESLVIRILPDQEYSEFSSIAYFPKDLDVMYNKIKKGNGLFIFTGPTGSGKTTTMYSILDKISIEDNKKILTIENPIEIINNNFVQMQINEEMNISYSVGLKAALRQDPDIIMIGEIRDEETARNVFRASLTGHTVISTMHTKDKYGVIERFIDFGFLFSEIESVLIGISNQRLILDTENDTKAFYDYAVSHNLKQMLSTKKEVETIDEKISKLQDKTQIK